MAVVPGPREENRTDELLESNSHALFPGASFEAVCHTMSFAQRMSQKSGDSRRQIIHNWVVQQVASFEAECNRVSDGGGYDAHYDCPKENDMPRLGGQRETETFRVAVVQALQNHGFRSLNVEKLRTSVPHRLQYEFLRISASWSWDVPAEAAACEGPAEGFVGSCGICHEDRPLVALAPCGHALCNGCQQLLRGQPCPFCRQPVQAVTRGIFVD